MADLEKQPDPVPADPGTPVSATPATPAKIPAGAAPASALRRLAIGTNVLIQLVLAFGLVMMLNYVAFKRPPIRWDVSRNSKFQLAPQTRTVLENLGKPVNAIVFSAGSPIQGDLETLMREAEYASKKKLTVEYVNPFSNITRAKAVAQQYTLGQQESNLVLDYGGKSKVISINEMAELDQGGMMFGQPPTVRSFKGEQVLTSALLELVEEKVGKMYSVTGHGEVDVTSEAVRGFKAYAERQNVKLDVVNLNNVDAVPADAVGLLLFGPQRDYSEREVKLLSDYWIKNGRLMVLLDAEKRVPRLEEFLAQQGLKVRGDAVIRTAQMPTRDPATGGIKVVSGIVPAVGVFAEGTPITKDLTGVNIQFISQTTSLEIDPAATKMQKITATPLINVSDSFWGETEYSATAGQGVFFDPKKDRQAPFPLAISIEKGAVGDPRVKVETARMVLVGNADFLTDQGLQVADVGIDFAVNSLNYLLNRENLIAIPPKPKEPVKLQLNDDQLTKLVLTTFLAIPAAIGVVGLGVWFRRRS